jgi:peptide deformylase
MSVEPLPIVTIGAPVLRERARTVTREELASAEMQRFIDRLIATMHAANGAGIAANQVGEAVRICVIEVEDNPRYPYKPNIPLTILVNAEIEPIGAAQFDNYEGCLSVPGMRGVVPRFAEARVKAWDRDGAELDFVVRGISAGTFQHELDHLDGVLYVDRVVDSKTLTTWESFDRYHKDAFIAHVEAVVARYGS